MALKEKVVYMTEEDVKKLIKNTVHTTFTQLGIQPDDPSAMQRDFLYLRDWRISTERMKVKTIVSVIAILISGLVGAFWLFLKQYLEGS